MPGLGMSEAQFNSIVWTSGYVRSYTDLKSIYIWPQCGAKLLFTNHFFGNLRSDFNGFSMPGLGMSQARCKSIVWTWGYLRLHTYLKSTHKWPQCGANTWHISHFSGIWARISTDFECQSLGWVPHSRDWLSGPQATSDHTQTWNPSTNGLSMGQNSFFTTIVLGIWGRFLTDFEYLVLGWVKHSANQLSGPEASSDCTQT